jgi:hypothetical protein
VRALGVIFCCLFFTAPQVSQASVWLTPEDIRVKHDVDLLKTQGLLPASIDSWPVYVPDLHRALLASRPDANASPLVQGAYTRMKRQVSQIQYAQSSLFANKTLGVQFLSQDMVFSGLEGEVSEKAGMTYQASIEQVYKSVAFRVNLNKVDSKVLMEDSYFAVPIGLAVLTLGEQRRWWGPGQGGNLVQSLHTNPTQGAHLQSVNSAQNKGWLASLGETSWQILAGIPNLEDFEIDFMAARLELKPLNTFQLGFSYLVSEDINNSRVLNNVQKQDLSALDISFSLPNSHALFYGQLSSGSVQSEISWMSGVSYQTRLFNLKGSFAGFAEGLYSANLKDGLNSPAAFSDYQWLGAEEGSGAMVYSLGVSFASDAGWLVKAKIKSVVWQDYAQSSVQRTLDLEAVPGCSGSSASLNGEKVKLLQAELAGEFYFNKVIRLKPSVTFQEFSEDFSRFENNLGLGLSVTYLY